MTLSKKKSETSNNRGCESSLSYSYLMSYCRYVRTMKGKCTPKGGSACCSRHSPCALPCLLLLFLLVAFCASPLSVRTVPAMSHAASCIRKSVPANWQNYQIMTNRTRTLMQDDFWCFALASALLAWHLWLWPFTPRVPGPGGFAVSGRSAIDNMTIWANDPSDVSL